MTCIQWTVDLKNAAGEFLTQIDVAVEIVRDFDDSLYIESVLCDCGSDFRDGRFVPRPPLSFDGTGLEPVIERALEADTAFMETADGTLPPRSWIDRCNAADARSGS